jgi:hypothetical protein
MVKSFILPAILLFARFSASFAAPSDTSHTTKKRYLITGLPVLFYTPETRFAFGATGLWLFNFKTDSAFAPKSSVNLSFVYTQNRQVLLSAPFNLFVQNRRYQLYGELGYNSFNYNFYGVGNDKPESYVERYGVEFPRLRLTVLRRLLPGFFGGLRYAFVNFSLFDLDPSGELTAGTIPGSRGGRVSGFGVVMLLDKRDNVFYPSRGIWSELVLYRDDPRFGSSFSYNRLAFDLCKYFHIRKHILALNLYSMYSDRDLPFFQMAMLGGMKRMRGFYEGRYRDNNALVAQAEYRLMVYGPLGFTIFGDIGQIAHRYHQLGTGAWRYTYGGGIRLMIDKTQKINLRFDVAVGNRRVLPYFTVGEAF